jgi:hypothetical protein
MSETENPSDLGVTFVKEVHRLAEVPRGATSWEPRGFSWWVADFRQRIWSEPGFDDNGSAVFKICAATDFVSEVDAAKLSEEMPELAGVASTSALVFDPQDRSLRHWTTVNFQENTGNWILPLFIGSAFSQAAAVKAPPEGLTQLIGGYLDQSRPPTGKRSCRHNSIEGWTNECRLEGKRPSEWFGTDEFAEAADSLRRNDIVAAVTETSLTAEFPFAVAGDYQRRGIGSVTSQRMALLKMQADQPHPMHGNGLHIRFKLPLSLPSDVVPKLCTALNLLETREFTRSCLIGSWCADGDAPVFVSFIPNIMHVDGMIAVLALAANARTAWIADKFTGDDDQRAASKLITSMLETTPSPGPDQSSKPGLLRSFFRR